MVRRLRRSSSRLRRSASAIVLVFACTVGVPKKGAAAPDSVVTYHIRAQDLGASLNALAIQNRIQLTYTSGIVFGRTAPALSGTYSVAEALRILLSGSGLTWRYLNDHLIIIERERQEAVKESPQSPKDQRSVKRASPNEPASLRMTDRVVVEEIVITGTRIVREGYEAPTPLTVVDASAIQTSSTANIADLMNTMPVFSASAQINNEQVSISNGNAGVNNLNLRGLGTVRTLVLLDGQRSVGSLLTGAVDVDTFPQQLVTRVDVVTGGASAVYGSDAVSGVVNFILDKQFVGLKAEIAGGVTTYGDDAAYSVSVSTGFGFGDARGHVLLSGEDVGKDGVIAGPSREWAFRGVGFVKNPAYTPTNGQPSLLYFPNQVGLSNGTPGGIIISGPLKGTAFGIGGLPYQFNYGNTVSDPAMHGGSWQTRDNLSRQASLDPSENRQNVFLRVSYDVADDMNIFVQASWASTHVFQQAFSQFNPGNAATILTGNPFIPSSVQAQMNARGLTSIAIGSMNFDLPSENANNTRMVNRNVIGASGKFDVRGSEWTWNTYFQAGYSRSSIHVLNDTYRDRFALAVDAVVNPATGSIVCRSALTDPANGCIPWNVMGQGVNDDAARSYLLGTAHLYQRLAQNVWSASLQGEPLSIWAGGVSLSVSVERRQERVSGFADANSLATNWFAGNYKPLIGEYDVTEGALETVVPLARNMTWAESWDFNAAARFTGYTTSGFVVTWKAGTTYTPNEDIKFRLTRSRDIRAPNLQELFAAGIGSQANLPLDPFTNTSPQYRGLQVGNPNLKPEKADTTGVGVVLSPHFLPGFIASIDFWNIQINDGIGSISPQDEVNLCYAGQQRFCSLISRNAPAGGQTYGTIFRIEFGGVNIAKQAAKGVDFEGSYRWSADDILSDWRGNFMLHANATFYLRASTDPGVPGGILTDTAGQNASTTAFAAPNWRLTARLSYELQPITASLTVRSISSGVYDNNYIVCETQCPMSTAQHQTVNYNHIDGSTYIDASFIYKLPEASNLNAEAFLNIRNLANQDPVPVAQLSIPYLLFPANSSYYDILGRVFRVGMRFRM